MTFGWGNTSGPVESGFGSKEEAGLAAPRGAVVWEICPRHEKEWHHSCPDDGGDYHSTS